MDQIDNKRQILTMTANNGQYKPYNKRFSRRLALHTNAHANASTYIYYM